MFRAVLFTQWRWARLAVVLGAVAAFALPVLSVRGVGADGAAWVDARALLLTLQLWSAWYAMLAATLGLILGTSAWGADHVGRHVYALSLPVARWRFALLRLLAGVALLLAPVVALWLGAHLAAASVAALLPEGLHAYPNVLAARFALATLVAYTVFFAISSGTTRTAGLVLGLGLLLVVLDVLFAIVGIERDVTLTIGRWITEWPGVFEVFSGRWMLIDV